MQREIGELISDIQRCERNNRWNAVAILVISSLITVVLSIVVVAHYATWVGWCVSACAVLSWIWVYRAGVRSLLVSGTEAAQILDTVAGTKERAVSYAELCEQRDSVNGVQRELLARQLSSIIPEELVAKNVVPYVLSQVERRALAVGVVCLAALCVALLFKPRSVFEELIAKIEQVEAQHPELPEDVKQALALLVEQISDPQAELQDVQTALETAHDTLDSSLRKSNLGDRPARKSGQEEHQQSNNQNEAPQDKQAPSGKHNRETAKNNQGGQQEQKGEQGQQEEQGKQGQQGQQGEQGQQVEQGEQGQQGEQGEQGQQVEQGEQGQQGEQGEQGQQGQQGEQGQQGQQGQQEQGVGTGGDGAGEKSQGLGNEEGKDSLQEGLTQLQQAVKKAQEELAASTSNSSGQDKEQNKSKDPSKDQTSNQSRDKTKEDKAPQEGKAKGGKQGSQRGAEQSQGQGAKNNSDTKQSEGSEKQEQERDGKTPPRNDAANQGDSNQGDSKKDDFNQRDINKVDSDKRDPNPGLHPSDGGSSPEVDRNVQAREGGFDPDAPKGPGLGRQGEFKDVRIEALDEKLDERFTGENLNPEQGESKAKPKTTIDDVTLAKPKSAPHKGEQPIPLEYRDILR